MEPKAEEMIKSPFLKHNLAEKLPAQTEPQGAKFIELARC
jgi:hypothetical protein